MKFLLNLHLAGFVILSLNLQAQDLELFKAGFATYPSARVIDSPNDQEVQLTEYTVLFNIPKKLKNEKTILVNGLEYGQVRPVAENDLAQNIDGLNLHLIGYRLMGIHKLSKTWNTMAILNPTISSAFNTSLEQDDFILNAVLHFFRKHSDELIYGLGIVRTARFGEPLIMPMIQFKVKQNRSSIDLLFPKHLKLDYTMHKVSMGMHMVINGSLFNTNYSRYTTLGQLELIDQLAYSRVLVGPAVSYRAGKILKLSAYGGVVVNRRIELRSEVFGEDNFDMENGPFIGLSLALVPPAKLK